MTLNMNRNKIRLDILPTDDYIFKCIFGVKENKDILLSFLNSLFKEFDDLPLISDLTIENNEISKEFANIRESRFDIILTTEDSSSINVEMQCKDTGELQDRSFTYLSHMIHDLPYKGSYKNPKAMSIWILKDNPRKDSVFYNRNNIIERIRPTVEPGPFSKDYSLFSNKGTIIFILLSKFKINNKTFNEKFEDWLTFLKDPDIIKENIKEEELKKAKERLTYLRQDRETRDIFDARQRFWEAQQSEFFTALDDAKKMGIREGLKQGLEKGKQEGLEEGKKEGLKEGLEKGIQKGQREAIEKTVMNMKKKGLDNKFISECLGISLEDIKKLLKF